MKHRTIVRTGIRIAAALVVAGALAGLEACASESNLRVRTTTGRDNVRISSGEGGTARLSSRDEESREETQSMERLTRDRERVRGGRF
jgi:hypothetical protein